MLKEFIDDIAEILDIESPTISFDTSKFLTKTTMAQIDVKESVIYIKPFDKINPDILFAIAHEIRHFWQYKIDEEYFFEDYKPANEFSSIDEYNLQLAEIDANAFAGLIMMNYFKIKPLFKNLSNEVKLAIQNRMDEIADSI